MMWWLIGSAVVVIGTAGCLADRYGQNKRKAKSLGRHANTGELPVTKHKLAEDWSYTTLDGIPKITDPATEVLPAGIISSAEVQSEAGLDYIKKRYGDITIHEPVEPVVRTPFLPPVPARTDTVMMETVDPAKYPDWINDELTKL